MYGFPQVKKLISCVILKLGKILHMLKKNQELLTKKDQDQLIQELISQGVIVPAENPDAPWPERIQWNGHGSASEALEEIRRDER